MVLLGQNGLSGIIAKNIAAGDWCGSLGWNWDTEKAILIPKSTRKQNLYKFRVLLATIYFSMVLIQVISSWKEAPLMTITHSVMFMSTAVLVVAFHVDNSINNKSVLAIFANFSKFEHQNPKIVQGNRESGHKLVKCIITSMAVNGIVAPLFYHMDILRNPCFPMYLGNRYSSQCGPVPGVFQDSTWNSDESLAKAMILSGSYFNWCFFFAGGCFHAGMELILLPHCIRTFVSYAGRQIENANTRSNKTVWLTWRQVQLLSNEYRRIFSKRLVGIFTAVISTVTIVSLYNSITVLKGGDATGGSFGYTMLYAWASVVGSFLLFTNNGVSADVYKTSKEVQNRLKKKFRQDKWIRRWLLSCPYIKIYFGSSNFFDDLTPLILLDFVIDQTVSLLLMS